MRNRKVRAWMLRRVWNHSGPIAELLQDARLDLHYDIGQRFIDRTVSGHNQYGIPVYSGIHLLMDAINENSPNRILRRNTVYVK